MNDEVGNFIKKMVYSKFFIKFPKIYLTALISENVLVNLQAPIFKKDL